MSKLSDKMRKASEKDLYIHRSMRKTLAYAADEIDRMDPVMRAWVDPGISPEYHYEMQEQLRREWPLLADALDKATEMRR